MEPPAPGQPVDPELEWVDGAQQGAPESRHFAPERSAASPRDRPPPVATPPAERPKPVRGRALESRCSLRPRTCDILRRATPREPGGEGSGQPARV